MPKATLINKSGNKVVVESGSAEATKYFGQGYSLMGADGKAVQNQSVELPKGSVPISGVQYNTREKQQSAFDQITPKGDTLYGVPKTLDEANDFINANQEEDFNQASKSDEPPTRYDEIKAGVDEFTDVFGNTGDRPETPDLTALYESFRTGAQGEMYNTTELEESMAFWKDQKRKADARRLERIEFEESQPVALGVIQGKTSEIQNQEDRELQKINNEIAYVTDQLNIKYSMIDTMMNLTQLDYKNASEAYDSQFSQNIQMINLVQGIQSNEKAQEQKTQDTARANLQIIQNNLTEGNMSYTDLTDDEKLNIRKLEIQAGLPAGFTERLKNSDPKANIISTTSRTDPSGKQYVDILTKNEDGKLTVQSIYTGMTKVSSSTSKT